MRREAEMGVGVAGGGRAQNVHAGEGKGLDEIFTRQLGLLS